LPGWCAAWLRSGGGEGQFDAEAVQQVAHAIGRDALRLQPGDRLADGLGHRLREVAACLRVLHAHVVVLLGRVDELEVAGEALEHQPRRLDVEALS